MAERSTDIIKVGYYLSRFGLDNPPKKLKVNSWKSAYMLFYDSLGKDRTKLQFEHSLKNTRDGFDSHFKSTNREGWKNENGDPAKLPVDAKNIYIEYESLSEEEIFDKIQTFISNGIPLYNHATKNLLNNNIEILNSFIKSCDLSNLKFTNLLIQRLTSSILTKPFVILTGLSGSGKTKLAHSFAMWLSQSKAQYAIISVGADWTNREPLLGYPNSLNNNHYVKPDSGVLDIVLAAYNNYNSNNQELAKCKPYFLILDEMNLSHVERYFADFLSTMESGDVIKLYSGGNRSSSLSATGEYLTASHVPDKIRLPKNLFIIGTVNIDETTYMFSPKVLDRANTIEFRISESEMVSFFETNGTLNMNLLLEDSQTNKGKGAQFTVEFMQLAAGEKIESNKSLNQFTFLTFFDQLQEVGAEFGYRTANEMTQLMAYLDFFGIHGNAAYDIAIMQKLLPKLHGSRSKLSKVLPALLNLCMDSSQEIIFPLSFEKLSRMQKNAQENGFASYAEA